MPTNFAIYQSPPMSTNRFSNNVDIDGNFQFTRLVEKCDSCEKLQILHLPTLLGNRLVGYW